jgi:hypothetical protein
MLAYLRVDDLAAMRLEAFVCAFLVPAHQARVARHIRGKNGGKTAGRGHFRQIVRRPIKDYHQSRALHPVIFRITLAPGALCSVAAGLVHRNGSVQR